jgi:hypothetical protein
VNLCRRIETLQMTSKPGLHHRFGKSVAETYLLATRSPVYRRRDSRPGFRTELENLSDDAKGKGTSSETARPKVPMHLTRPNKGIIATDAVARFHLRVKPSPSWQMHNPR